MENSISIEKIELGEGCFGPIVYVNDVDLFEHEYDKEENIKDRNIIKKQIFKEIIEKHLDSIDSETWTNLLSIIVIKENYIVDENDSYEHKCDQCGNYNSKNTYIR